MARDALAKRCEEADLPYLLENMPGAADRAIEGLQRVATIVRSLKEFAHPDQKEKTYADLNQAIASTLTIARNEYKYVADVQTEFGDLPLVPCHLGDFNQAVLNIVINAAHAVESVIAAQGGRGRITVRTRRERGEAVIEIEDTGCGIPEAIRDRIFDPFFTTKPVGKGTGQGLAIARSVIVDRHQGMLSVSSKEGAGTTFTIRLPLDRDGSGLALAA
jgi:signal transduction histidine kinase